MSGVEVPTGAPAARAWYLAPAPDVLDPNATSTGPPGLAVVTALSPTATATGGDCAAQ